MLWIKRVGLLILISLAVAIDAQAFSFNFPFLPGSSNREERQPPGPGPWQYRPQEPSHARGVPPSYQPPGGTQDQTSGYQQPSYQQPGYQQPGYPQPGFGYQRGWPGPYQSPYGQQATQQGANAPRLELELSNHQPYVEENALLKLKVVSSQNLKTATPELPSSNDVLLQKVEGPKAYSRTGPRGGREIVNEFVYTLTPLHAGTVEVPPLRVTGTAYGNGYGPSGDQPFDVKSSEPIRLQVRPAMASVRPWLPLQDLALKATLDGGDEVEEGKPVTLALELKAVGATGSQLPSLESMLRSPDFRVYREQTLTEGELSADGRHLDGKRTEYYTLVPRSGGKLKLPEIRLPWWNVETGTEEYASLPIRTLQAEGEAGRYGLSPSASTSGGGGLSWFWFPLAGVLLLLLGYWGGVWYKGRLPRLTDKEPLRARLGSGLGSAAAKAASAATAVANRMNPAPLLARLKPRLSRSLPPSSRFLMCVRKANQEEDPAAWADRFAAMTCRHLQLDTQTPLPGMTGKILALRPGADQEQLSRLMQQLDGALYGNQDIDFKRWKKQFRAQVGRRRGIAGASGRRLRLVRARLPALNPHAG